MWGGDGVGGEHMIKEKAGVLMQKTPERVGSQIKS